MRSAHHLSLPRLAGCLTLFVLGGSLFAQEAAPPAAAPILDDLLPYNDRLARRDLRSIDLVVIHCTESPDLEAARLAAETVRYPGSGTGNAGHYYIDRDGTVYRYVEDDRIAHHVIGFNDRSIGIELVNTGRAPNWFHSEHQAVSEPYPEPQIAALLELLRDLEVRRPSLKWIAGHHHLDLSMIETSDRPEVEIRRKVDPGPLFPWSRVMAATSLERIGREPSRLESPSGQHDGAQPPAGEPSAETGSSW